MRQRQGPIMASGSRHKPRQQVQCMRLAHGFRVQGEQVLGGPLRHNPQRPATADQQGMGPRFRHLGRTLEP
jgi:hypothetical protein